MTENLYVGSRNFLGCQPDKHGTMSVHDAQPGDIYADRDGKLWRVISICGEPTVCVQEIESITPETPVRRSGGVSGYMWGGFTRIFRPGWGCKGH